MPDASVPAPVTSETYWCPDWLGVYARHADPNVAPYLLWIYTRAAVAGRFALGRGANGPWPLRPGRYTVYLLRDDLYVKLAGADFTIR